MTDEHQYPISECFGPTIQGEGPLVGAHTFFVRFAGCDFDCEWCDTKYAVRPSYPGWTKTMMTAPTILHTLSTLGAFPGDWVALSGGNPALFVDHALLHQMAQFRTLLETQGSIAIEDEVNTKLHALIISPKPPSSGMADRFDPTPIRKMLAVRSMWSGSRITALKYVVFNAEDIAWVKQADQEFKKYWTVPRYLSIGTNLVNPDPTTQIIDSARKVAELIVSDHDLRRFTLGIQLHVLLYGQRRGV